MRCIDLFNSIVYHGFRVNRGVSHKPDRKGLDTFCIKAFSFVLYCKNDIFRL